MLRPSTIPVTSSIRSANVDLPWSMWAMMQKFRMRAGSVRAGAVTVRPSSHAGTTENAIACSDVSGDALPVSSPGSPRLPYADLPAGLRAAVDGALGSPVVAVSPRTGGFSAGPAAVLTCASGRRVFVKAVGTPIDPGTLELVRREGRTAALLPASLPVPALVAQVDHDDPDGSAWTALLLEEVGGAVPVTPWTVEAARAVLADVVACTAAATPCPVPDLPPFSAAVADELSRWALLVDEPPADLTGWERAHLDRLVCVPDRLLDRGGCVGDSLVHTDLRADNLLVTPDGSTVLLDWAWACVGPAWVDPVLLALDMAVHGGLDPQALVEDLPAVRAADPRDVTDVLAGLTGMWGVSMRRPAPPHMPTLRSFQRRFHDAALTWVQRRATVGRW